MSDSEVLELYIACSDEKMMGLQLRIEQKQSTIDAHACPAAAAAEILELRIAYSDEKMNGIQLRIEQKLDVQSVEQKCATEDQPVVNRDENVSSVPPTNTTMTHDDASDGNPITYRDSDAYGLKKGTVHGRSHPSVQAGARSSCGSGTMPANTPKHILIAEARRRGAQVVAKTGPSHGGGNVWHFKYPEKHNFPGHKYYYDTLKINLENNQRNKTHSGYTVYLIKY